MFSRSVAIFCVLIVMVSCVAVLARSAKHSHRVHDASHAKVARRLVHKSNWTSMGTLSTNEEFVGFPMVNIISMADSPLGEKSTGHIYYLLTDLDFTGQDLHKENKLTTLFSDDQDLSCTRKQIDSMEPTCARVIITGQSHILNETSSEYHVADAAYTSRHPASVHWRNTHEFYLCELIIEKIALLDYYGGPKFISADEYYAANFDEDDENDVAVHRGDVIPSVISPKSFWWNSTRANRFCHFIVHPINANEHLIRHEVEAL